MRVELHLEKGTLRRGTCGGEQDGKYCVLPPDHRLPHSDGNAYWSK